MHPTALEYVALAGSSKTVPQCTPRSGPEAGQRAGSGGSHQPPDQAPVAGQESGPVPPGLGFWSVAMTELKRRLPTTTTLVELKETIGSFAQSIDDEVKQVVWGIRRRSRARLERNGAARLRRDSSGPDNVVLCRPLTVICVLKLKQ